MWYIELLCKVRSGFQVCAMRSEVVLDVLQVIGVLQLRHVCTKHLEIHIKNVYIFYLIFFVFRNGQKFTL